MPLRILLKTELCLFFIWALPLIETLLYHLGLKFLLLKNRSARSSSDTSLEIYFDDCPSMMQAWSVGTPPDTNHILYRANQILPFLIAEPVKRNVAKRSNWNDSVSALFLGLFLRVQIDRLLDGAVSYRPVSPSVRVFSLGFFQGFLPLRQYLRGFPFMPLLRRHVV